MPKLPDPRVFAVLTVILALGAGMMGFSLTAAAAVKKHVTTVRTSAAHRRTSRTAAHVTPMPAGATDPDKDAELIIDGTNGKVLYARNENAERHPASLTKMMTLYLLFDALRSHRISMDTQMPVSYHASVQKPTKLSLRTGQTIDVDTAIRAIVIRSANDVAVVIAEALGGTEGHFAELMTDKARQLGMRQTNYHNASGLPDPLQITTASDLSILARHLGTDFPQYWSYFSLAGFNYKGVYYPTHDNLIGKYQGADGIKTGYTGASGFNLASSVERDGAHLIGIVMGGRTAVRRDLEMEHLLDTEFAQISLNPTLVAHNAAPLPGAPFQTATGIAQTVPYSDQIAALSANPAPLPVTDDEEAAETLRAPDEAFAVIHAEAPAKTPQQAAASKPARPAPAQRPTARPGPMVAAATPTARPLISPPVATSPLGIKDEPAVPPLRVATQTPQLRPEIGEGDIDQPGTPVPGRNWVIQIGAYADQALAKAQLASYAQRAQDVLGRAAKIVAPIQGSNGHMLYRARFGLFAEREARQVCDRLTQRGQTCFAAVATR